MENFTELPKTLPAPVDDGGCDHLLGGVLPSVALPSTQDRDVDLSAIPGLVVIYCYPMTGQPGISLPDGWDEIPVCTPQSCAFRDHYQELAELKTLVFGLSTQSTEYQKSAGERLHLPFELLSDFDLKFTKMLKLPKFEIAGLQLLKRVTLIAKDRKIIKVFYPVFPPDRNADEVLIWLQSYISKSENYLEAR